MNQPTPSLPVDQYPGILDRRSLCLIGFILIQVLGYTVAVVASVVYLGVAR